MATISEYKIIEKIHEDIETVFYRSNFEPEHKQVIIKLLKSEYLTLKAIARLRHEYQILKCFTTQGVIKPYSLEKYQNSFALILEDFAGQPLSQILKSRQLTVSECLVTAITLVSILMHLNQVGIIHKDIQPNNIIVNTETGEVKLINFTFSSILYLEKQIISDSNLLEGSLAYMAPEQTGRINRSIDYRADFYSLGVTLYEMLTGRLPFTSDDPLELIHCHIAKQPVAPHVLVEIPKTISNIVMKLLAKNAEERYQSATGLKFDLETCLQQLESTGEIQDFILGQRDCGSQISRPQLHNWFYSLALLAEYSNHQMNNLQECLSQVEENQNKMKYWAEHAPMNYQHKYELVEAEKARVLGQLLEAMDYYECAIAGAHENGYLQEEALAYELAAKFYLSLGRKEIARTYMTKAHCCYINWGAITKAKDLESKYPNIIILSKSFNNTYAQVLDSTTIIKASQAIASELILERLLHKLITIVIENAGAQIGFLILKQQEKLFIEAKGNINTSEFVVSKSVLDETSEQLPNSLINYVIRTKEDVILTDAIREGIFTRDKYIIKNRPLSILCTPIIYRGDFCGVLYLENNLTVGAFTPQRLEILKILSSQAVIAIKNAQLYQNCQQEISERQQAEAELALKNTALQKVTEELAKYSHNLEDKVQERTKELSQTLEALRATQVELVKSNQELHRLSRIDKLTQIANRSYFDEYLLQQWSNLELDQQPLSLIICDVDYFKKYNDFYGHQCGDHCLQKVAETLLSVVKCDTHLVSRYGGEEFAVIMPSTDVEQAIVVARKIQQAIHQAKLPHACSDISEYITISSGIATVVPNITTSPKTLIAVADKALYEAKLQGRNRYVCSLSTS